MNLSTRAIAVQGIGFGARFVALQGFAPLVIVDARPAQGDAPPRTSRYSDDRAYDRDRVLDRLSKVVIAGKEYDPFDPRLVEILESAAMAPEPQAEDELERQERKLARKFVVRAGDRDIDVPMFRPMLREMPNFKEAFAKDFEKYAEKAAIAAAEERRRILLLLLSSDF